MTLPFKAVIKKWQESEFYLAKAISILNALREYSTFTFLSCCLFWGSSVWVVSTYKTKFFTINFTFQRYGYAFSEVPIVILIMKHCWLIFIRACPFWIMSNCWNWKLMAGSDPECYVYLDRCIFPNLNEY